MLQNALANYGFDANAPVHLVDTYAEVSSGLKSQLEETDVLIISGGISVGDYDFVGKSLIENGVEQRFYKVNQKPGKPLFFGTKGNKLVFALPGNPAAALTCFLVYVIPALRKMTGYGFKELPRTQALLKGKTPKPSPKEQFLKGYLLNSSVEILEGQSSAMLRTFADANALIHLPANHTLQNGEEVEIILL